jgi:FkbM family methyltransferase
MPGMLDPKRRAQKILMGNPRLYLAARRWFGVSRYFARRPHDEDFRFFRRFDGEGGLFLDVGANSGISALSYRIFDRSSRILSLEPNATHARDLRLVRRILGSDFSYRLQAAGAEPDELTLFVPVYRGVPLTGEASLNRDEVASNWTAEQLGIAAGDIEIEEMSVEVRPVDELELDPHAVKIDVEGAELSVLAGMTATLERTHPVLLIEASAEIQDLVDQLAPFGYEAHVYSAVDDRVEPFDGRETTNVFFIAKS